MKEKQALFLILAGPAFRNYIEKNKQMNRESRLIDCVAYMQMAPGRSPRCDTWGWWREIQRWNDQ